MQFTGDNQLDLITALTQLQTETTRLLGRLRYLKAHEDSRNTGEEIAETIGAIARVLLQQTELLGRLRSERLFVAVQAQQEHERATRPNTNHGPTEDNRARNITVGDSVRILDPGPGEPIIGIVTLIEGNSITVRSRDDEVVQRRANQVVLEDITQGNSSSPSHE